MILRVRVVEMSRRADNRIIPRARVVQIRLRQVPVMIRRDLVVQIPRRPGSVIILRVRRAVIRPLLRPVVTVADRPERGNSRAGLAGLRLTDRAVPKPNGGRARMEPSLLASLEVTALGLMTM